MSGIFGLVRLDGAPVEETLFRQVFQNFLTPNSPDGAQLDTFWSQSQAMVLGRLHLGIINPEPQPALSPDHRFQLFLDGEIYNEDFDLHHQPQALTEAFQREQAALFQRLNGHFFLAIVEPEAQRLTLVTDRTASLQVFYLQVGNLFAFSPQLQPLLRVPNFQPRINALALTNFLSTGSILEGKSLIQGIQVLGPASVLRIERSQIRVEPYWEFSYQPERDQRAPQILQEELFELLVQAVRRQTWDQIPSAITLSGGWDSRAILWCMRKLYPERPLRSITWGVDDVQSDSDAVIARQTARHFNTQHTFFPLEAGALTRHFHPFVSVSECRVDAVGNYPESLRIFERIRSELKVNMLFRGNEPFGARRRVTRPKQALNTAFIPDWSCFPKSFRYFHPALRQRLKELNLVQAHRLWQLYPYDDPTDRKDHLFLAQRWPGYQSVLTQLKRCVIEERSPFLDNDIIEFVRRLPAHQRYWKSLYTETIRRLMPDLPPLGFSQTHSLIPWESRIRTDLVLQGFVRQVLTTGTGNFADLVDRRRLEDFLNRAFMPKTYNRRTLWRRVVRRAQTQLDIYDLELDLEIFRLMMFKTWVEEHLSGNFALT